MKVLSKIFLVATITILFVNCADDKFKVANGRVGKVNSKTIIQELDEIFADDSIVKNLIEGKKSTGKYMQDEDEYLIFEKGGKHLLTITPKKISDQKSTIKSVEIFDGRFKTQSGVNLNSTFQEVNAVYSIGEKDINTTISSVSIHIKELNSDVILSKEDLGVKGFGETKILPDQIPDLSKVKSFVVWFN